MENWPWRINARSSWTFLRFFCRNLLAIFFQDGEHIDAQAGARDMIKRGDSGDIITIDSVRGLVDNPLGYVAYGTTKRVVHLLTRQLATEWTKYKIHVNAIAPSVVETPLANLILKTPVVKALFMSRIPFGRPMIPDELVGTAIYPPPKRQVL
jgi:NAD(P)-dependent dehydrogenase (short-subunit alcohol dehydrogenase family)